MRGEQTLSDFFDLRAKEAYELRQEIDSKYVSFREIHKKQRSIYKKLQKAYDLIEGIVTKHVFTVTSNEPFTLNGTLYGKNKLVGMTYKINKE